jgi:predicted transcriptional regulator
MQVKQPLKQLLEDGEITQAELADGIGKSEAMVSRLVAGEAAPSKETIDSILTFLTKRLGRRVTYEKAFGSPAIAGRS